MNEMSEKNIEFMEQEQNCRKMMKLILVYAEKMREIFRKQNEDTFIKRIGNTTYKVRVHFDKDSKEPVKDKVMHLIQTELAKTLAERSIYE